MWPLKCPRRSAYCDLTESSSGLVSLFEGRFRTACHIKCQTTCSTHHSQVTMLTMHTASMCMHDELDKISTFTLLLTFNMPRFAVYADTCTNKRSALGKEPYSYSLQLPSLFGNPSRHVCRNLPAAKPPGGADFAAGWTFQCCSLAEPTRQQNPAV